MLKIGVQSKGILDSELLDLETGFERIKKAGFDCIDLNLDVFLKNSELYQGEMNRFFEQSMEELRQYFTSYQEGAEQYSLSWSQMHAPYPVWCVEGGAEPDYDRNSDSQMPGNRGISGDSLCGHSSL